ncbi:hypothetical protein EDB19DRAFT_1909804 [Suillus lakei]|nr:hypothetical protein EDB19DRAFT_1909804 [Suillus lakei]
MPSNSKSKSKSRPKHYFSTLAVGIKLGSFIKVPLIHDVPMMDKLTTQELNQLVLDKPASQIKRSTPIGYLLSIIFQSFKVQTPRAEDLRIPVSQIQYTNERINNQFHQYQPTDSVELWDSNAKMWNWGLPDPPPKKHKKNKKGKKTWGGTAGGEGSQAPRGSTSNSNLATEHVVAGLLNTLMAALSRHGLGTNQMNRVWSGAHSTTPIKGEDIPHKYDIVMSDEPNPGWAGVKVVTEVMSSKYRPGKSTTKSLDTKAYIILKHQPWRCFALMLSLCNHYRELRVHIYNHSGSAISPPFHIDQQKDKFLQSLSSIVFGNDECLGFDTTMNIRQLKLPVLSHRSIPPRRLCARKKRDTSGTQAKPVDVAALGGESGEESGEESDESGYDSSSSYKPSPSRCLDTLGGDPLSSAFPSLERDERPDIRTGLPTLPSELLPSATPASLAPFIVQTSIPPNSSPISEIQVNENWYNILEVLFSSHGLVGRSTICYLARKGDEEYIIKDHWVLGNADNEDTLNEVVMLKKMQGVCGVPVLVEFSKVKLSTGEADNMKIYRYQELPSLVGTWHTHFCIVMKPRGRPLHKFQTKLEFIKAIRDIVAIEQKAHAQGILHCDCSLHNAMIKDANGNSLGMLIDWEFAVAITPENKYAIGGTGTIPFMSRWLLQQVKKILVSNTAQKGVLSSSPLAIEFVKQDYSDDLESLFYVFSWICIGYSGPLGVEHHLNTSKAWLPHAWSNRDIRGCFENKVAFYTVGDGKTALQTQFDDYFKDLVPLALEWMDLLRLNFPVQIGSVDGQALHRPIEFDALLKILDKHITKLLKGTPELPPERLLRQRLVDKNKQDVHASGEIMKGMDCPAVKKRGLNDEWTVEPVKRSKASNSG